MTEAQQKNGATPSGFAKLGKQTKKDRAGLVVHGREIGSMDRINDGPWTARFPATNNSKATFKAVSDDLAEAAAEIGKAVFGFDGAVPGGT